MDASAPKYWEDRAIKFGHVYDGLPAVCSYGMPWLYNYAIHLCQRRALSRWLRVTNTDVLDFGCGVGRWSLRFAGRNNRVVGLDISSRMIELAKQSAARRQIDCEFLVRDIVSFDLGRQFDLVIGVTVLQHVIDDTAARTAVANLARHVRATGVLVMLEVAPSRPTDRCDSPTFRTRTFGCYEGLAREAGLEVVDVQGVDISPFRPWLLPAMPRLPRALARAAAATSALASLPVDLIASSLVPHRCWHKVIVAVPR